MTLSEIECWVPNNFFPKESYFIDRCSPPGKSSTYIGGTNTSIRSITQDISYIFFEDHSLYLIASCLCRPLKSYLGTLSTDDRPDNSVWMCLKD